MKALLKSTAYMGLAVGLFTLVDLILFNPAAAQAADKEEKKITAIGFPGLVTAVDAKNGEVRMKIKSTRYFPGGYPPSALRIEAVDDKRWTAVCTFRVGGATRITVGGKPATLADVPADKIVDISVKIPNGELFLLRAP